MNCIRNRMYRTLQCVFLATIVAMTAQSTYGQASVTITEATRRLPSAAEHALAEANRASSARLQTLERNWREIFRQSRDRDRLAGFVGETLGIFEKLRQFKDFALTPGATETRVGALFRKRIMDETAVCRMLEESLNDYCAALDQHDQSLLIKLKLDRDAARTKLSRSAIDSNAFKRSINRVAASAVIAVQRDMARSVGSFVASEAISAVAKKAARDLGVNRTKPGSFGDFLSSLVIEATVGIVVERVTDPTQRMVSDLQANLAVAENEILDADSTTPGFITTLRRITSERAVARRKLLEAEILK